MFSHSLSDVGKWSASAPANPPYSETTSSGGGIFLDVLSASMYRLISSHGTTSLGSSIAFNAKSISGKCDSIVWVRFNQICVQNQSLPAVALPFRTLIVISKSLASLRICSAGKPQNGPRSW